MNRVLFVSLMILTTALMGSSFSIGKIGLAYVSPLLLAAIRFLLAGLLMALLVAKRPHPKQLVDWWRIVLIGLFQTAGVMGAIFLSMKTITVGESAILTFLNPLIVVILGTLFLGAVYKPMQWIGVILGFLGVFIAMGFHLQMALGTWIGLFGAVSWAVATLLAKKWMPSFDVWVLTAYQMMAGGVILLLVSVSLEPLEFHFNGVSLFAILWLAIMGSIVQFAVWFYLLQHGDPGKTSAFLFLAPFFGILSGWMILGEEIPWFVWMGSFFIFIGIFLVNWPGRMKLSSLQFPLRIR